MLFVLVAMKSVKYKNKYKIIQQKYQNKLRRIARTYVKHTQVSCSTRTHRFWLYKCVVLSRPNDS